MQPCTGLLRASRAVHSAAMLGHETGGISVVLFRATNPVPRPIRKDFRYGDIGVAKITMAVSDVDSLYGDLEGRLNFCSKHRTAAIPGWGDYSFVYARDPEGNLIEFMSARDEETESKSGGVRSIGISVTDLDRSVAFYRKSLGFDRIVVASHTAFSGLVDEISGGRRHGGSILSSCEQQRLGE